jgi:hypothetical protein
MSLSLTLQIMEFQFELPIFYRVDQAAKRAEQLGLRSHGKIAMGEKQQVSSNSGNPNLPSVDVSYIQLQISHVRWAKFYLHFTYL